LGTKAYTKHSGPTLHTTHDTLTLEEQLPVHTSRTHRLTHIFSALYAGGPTNGSTILADSGCSAGLFYDKRYFTTLYNLEAPVTVKGISGNVTIKRAGTVCFVMYDALEMPQTITLENCYLNEAYGAGENLLSVDQLNNTGYHVRFDIGNPHLHDANSGTILPLLRRADWLFSCPHQGIGVQLTNFSCNIAPSAHAARALNSSMADIIHCRFHVPYDRVQQTIELLPSLRSLGGNNSHSGSTSTKCHDCMDANARRLPHKRDSTRTYIDEHDCWSMDMFDMGEDMRSSSGNSYVFLFVIHRSRFTLVELAASKADALTAYQRVCNRLGMSPRISRADKAKEFVDDKFMAWCDEHGTAMENSVAYSQFQNGKAETLVDTLNRLLRVLMLQSGLDHCFWPYALHHAVLIYNHLIHSATGSIPIIDHGRKDVADTFRAFGCRCTVHFGKDRVSHGKLSPRGKPGIFIGSGLFHGEKSWLVHLPTENTVVSSCNVDFDETAFPLRNIDSRVDCNFEHYQDSSIPLLSTTSARVIMDFTQDDLPPTLAQLQQPASNPRNSYRYRISGGCRSSGGPYGGGAPSSAGASLT